MRKARLGQMYLRLTAVYGPQQWWPAATSFEVIVGAYLTQNTSWKGVERSIQNLAAHGSLTIDGVRGLPDEELRQLIRPSGFMVRKAAALKAFVTLLDREYRGSLSQLAAEQPETARVKLLALPGVGPETADAILLYALGHPAMVVDEYLRRIVTRHRLLPAKATYSEIQALAIDALNESYPEGDRNAIVQHYNEFHALVVMVGKTHCGPTPKCDGCPLAEFLPISGPFLK
ncbi:Endonuclease III [Acidisarcina polymorpha]|uniref:Endonuclease III n=1 Tax=Acidisarcina polymorpha TaxID=2211140 RepID=A0A2Z5G770_9BACT|nr:base excision DNA repair protein [Acidisarcina polymorpha]AXC14829.1 Endonuclease III [Acidisarcina polymorpha]